MGRTGAMRSLLLVCVALAAMAAAVDVEQAQDIKPVDDAQEIAKKLADARANVEAIKKSVESAREKVNTATASAKAAKAEADKTAKEAEAAKAVTMNGCKRPKRQSQRR